MLSAETASSEKNIAVEIIELGQNFGFVHSLGLVLFFFIAWENSITDCKHCY